jgi:hydrogenase nickel incorporation protein HypB
MFSISEGDDKAAKHPYLVCAASVVLLNKMDLLPHVPFRLDTFREDIKQLNPDVPLLEISVQDGTLEAWMEWLQNRVCLAPSA